MLLTDDAEIPARYFAMNTGFLPHDRAEGCITGRDFKERFGGRALEDLDVSTYTVLSGFDSESKMAFLKAEKKNGIVVYAGSGSGDTALLAEADAGIVCSQRASQTARAAADVLGSPSAEKSGGIRELYSAVCRAKAAYFNLRHAAAYLVTSQVARLALVLYAVIFRFDILTPQQLLVWGLLFDFLAVLIIAFEKPDNHVLLLKMPVSIPLATEEILRASLCGLLWAVITVAVPAFARLLGLPMENDVVRSFVFLSAMITLVFIATENTNERSVFSPGVTLNAAYLLFVLGAAVLVIVCVVSRQAAAYLGLGRPDWVTLLLTLIPALIMTAVYEIFKRVRK